MSKKAGIYGRLLNSVNLMTVGGKFKNLIIDLLVDHDGSIIMHLIDLNVKQMHEVLDVLGVPEEDAAKTVEKVKKSKKKEKEDTEEEEVEKEKEEKPKKKRGRPKKEEEKEEEEPEPEDEEEGEEDSEDEYAEVDEDAVAEAESVDEIIKIVVDSNKYSDDDSEEILQWLTELKDVNDVLDRKDRFLKRKVTEFFKAQSEEKPKKKRRRKSK